MKLYSLVYFLIMALLTCNSKNSFVEKELNSLKVENLLDSVSYIQKFPIKEIIMQNCDKGRKIFLLADTIVPNYYIRSNDVNYRLDSYQYSMKEISFWYDIYINFQRDCSFILFFGEKPGFYNGETGRYSYTIFNVADNEIKTATIFYYTVLGYKDKKTYNYLLKKYNLTKLKTDTIANLTIKDTVISLNQYFKEGSNISQIVEETGLKTKSYLLRNKKWTSKPKNLEEEMIRNKCIRIY